MNHQTSNDSMHAISAFFTFVCGAIAGAAVALMFAPGTGRDTRAFLTQRGRRVAEKGRQLLNEHGAAVSDAIERGRGQAFAFGERLGQAVEQGKAGYRGALRQRPSLAGAATKSADEPARGH